MSSILQSEKKFGTKMKEFDMLLYKIPPNRRTHLQIDVIKIKVVLTFWIGLDLTPKIVLTN